jgi:NAD(P)-dependent dehydrogenase (short-subunit alcohol dehydrogenase family)
VPYTLSQMALEALSPSCLILGNGARTLRSLVVVSRLSGKIALVTGASRGAGRGIATVLGSEGAIVYVTGRTSRGHPAVADFPHSVEETAEEVTAAGGRGVAVVCDHTDDTQVRALFQQIRSEQGHLDVLVANAWGGYMPYAEHNEWFNKPFWEQSMDRWDGMFAAGLRSHFSSCLFGLPLLREAGYGLAVLTTFTRGRSYLGNAFYDVAKNAVCRLVTALAEETRNTDLAIVGVSPGWMAVERMTGLSDRQVAEMESVNYIGRAIASLACDPAVSRRSGQTLAVGDLARIYGFTDIDGHQPTPYIIES